MTSPGPDRYDVVVVGGGPAGSATAIGLLRARPDLRVLVVDRSRFPRDKSCGDAISPASVADLRDLGAEHVVDGYERNTGFSFTGPSGRTASAAQFVRDGAVVGGYTVPRQVFDHRLLRLAQDCGAHVRDGLKFVSTGLGERGRQVVVQDGSGPPQTLHAGVLVGADGAYSTVRRALGVPKQADAMTAISTRCYVEQDEESSELGPIRFEFHRELLPAYAWHFPVDRRRANVGVALPVESLARGTTDLNGALDTFIRKLQEQGMPITRIHPKRGHLLPHAGHIPPLSHPRAALVGDAGSMINPFSGEGIHYAMRAGLLLAQSLKQTALHEDAAVAAGLDAYEHAFRARFAAHLRSGRLAQRLAAFPVTADLAVWAASRGDDTLDSMYELLFGEGRLNVALGARFLRSLAPR